MRSDVLHLYRIKKGSILCNSAQLDKKAHFIGIFLM